MAYDSYVNSLMASQSLLLETVKHIFHVIFKIDVNKKKRTQDTDVTLLPYFPLKR